MGTEEGVNVGLEVTVGVIVAVGVIVTVGVNDGVTVIVEVLVAEATGIIDSIGN